MLAAAKINLDLRITGRREDGYHLLDSIVVFTELGDYLTAEHCDELSLVIDGEFSKDISNNGDNLVLKAAHAICKQADVRPNLKFYLKKNLPSSSGIGGGSADAAAALKICNDMLGINFDQNRLKKIALQIGADVPACLLSKACRMTGIGGIISPIEFDNDLQMLLVNPGISISTPAVFTAYKSLDTPFEKKRAFSVNKIHLPLMIDQLKSSKNSLQDAACQLESRVSGVLGELSDLKGAVLSRMSGSGATCFALFENEEDCKNAASDLQRRNPDWWIKMTRFG